MFIYHSTFNLSLPPPCYRTVLPWMKLFLKKLYKSWLARRYVNAVKIQSIFLMYREKVKLFRLVGRKYVSTVPRLAAVKIQKVMRGIWDRRLIPPLFAAMLVQKVDIPSAICIQRVQRGRVGRKLAMHRKLQIVSANKIQKVAKRFLYRCENFQILFTFLIALDFISGSILTTTFINIHNSALHRHELVLS